MPDLPNINLLADAFRHRIYRENDFAIISIDATSKKTPVINVTNTFPQQRQGNELILSRYALGQWLNQTDAQIEKNVSEMLSRKVSSNTFANLVTAVKNQASQLATIKPPDTADVAYAIASDIPAEVEILLRRFPDLNQLRGSIFLVKDNDEFLAGKLNTTVAEDRSGGRYLLNDKIVVVTNAIEDLHYCINVPPWRAVGIHEIIHFVDDLIYNDDEANLPLSLDIISIEDSLTIEDELHQAMGLAQGVMGTAISRLDDDEKLFLDNFTLALFPSGTDKLKLDNPAKFLDNLIMYTNDHFHYISSPKHSFNIEHLARGLEIIHILASEIQIAEPETTRDESLKRAGDAIRLFSPTLVDAIEVYNTNRDAYLNQLRQQQGKLEGHIRYDTLPPGPNIPDPTHVNTQAKAKITSRPADITTESNRGIN